MALNIVSLFPLNLSTLMSTLSTKGIVGVKGANQEIDIWTCGNERFLFSLD